MRHGFVGCVMLLWAVEGLATTGAAVQAQTVPSPAERMLNEMLNPAPAAPPTTRPGTRVGTYRLRAQGCQFPVAP